MASSWKELTVIDFPKIKYQTTKIEISGCACPLIHLLPSLRAVHKLHPAFPLHIGCQVTDFGNGSYGWIINFVS